jgi:flagellar biosynthesis protein FlhA
MPSANSHALVNGWTRINSVVLPITFVGALLVFIVPVPPVFLDLLISANITLAVLVLLTTLAVRSPLEFSAFPTILLTTTLTRLVLNVATTRLTLSRAGTYGLDAAGGVIRAFGEFVAGDQVVIGVIIFVIIFVIQFVVITKGATRISEVAARFMLDGLPGRQMAIDADLHAGMIDQHQAHDRREHVHRQADFFGAMDGAGKFVRGDAIAGVIITLVNIGAGLFLGIVNYKMSFSQAAEVFTKLTIGDGLVSQVPAFLTSLAAGLIVTRSSEDSDLGNEVVGQMLGKPRVLIVASVFLVMLAFTPLPKLPLLTIAASLAVGAYWLNSRDESHEEISSKSESEPSPVVEQPTERMEDLLHVDPLELEIGYRLISLADLTRGGDLLDRLRAMRHRVAQDLGLIVPQVRIRDEIGLGPHDYRIKIRGTVVAQGTAYAGRLLAVPPAGMVTRPDGRDGVDPVSGQPAVWIHNDGREVAELAGCRVIEASAVVSGHFGEVVLGHADELMTREQVARLLEKVRATSPTIVDEVVPGLLRAGEVQQVLQNLLRERVSVRDLETILESLAVHAGKSRSPEVLTEYARQALARRIVQGYLGKDGRLRVVTLTKSVDDLLVMVGQDETRPDAALGPDAVRDLVRAVASAVAPLVDAGHPPIVLGSAAARPVLKDLTRADLPRLIVLSQREIPRDTPVEECGMVAEDEVPEEAAAMAAAKS